MLPMTKYGRNRDENELSTCFQFCEESAHRSNIQKTIKFLTQNDNGYLP